MSHETNQPFRVATNVAYFSTCLAILGLVAAPLLWQSVMLTLCMLPIAVGGLIWQEKLLERRRASLDA